MKKRKKGSGGLRVGAGRKPSGRPVKKRVSITLEPDILNWLKKQPMKISTFISLLIKNHREHIK